MSTYVYLCLPMSTYVFLRLPMVYLCLPGTFYIISPRHPAHPVVLTIFIVINSIYIVAIADEIIFGLL